MRANRCGIQPRSRLAVPSSQYFKLSFILFYSKPEKQLPPVSKLISAVKFAKTTKRNGMGRQDFVAYVSLAPKAGGVAEPPTVTETEKVTENHTHTPTLQLLLQQFHVVFQEAPTELPPFREEFGRYNQVLSLLTDLLTDLAPLSRQRSKSR